MRRIEKSVEVSAPVDKVYNQWTQFEDFPEFMEGVERVQQVDKNRLHWVASVAGRKQEWDAEITQEVPDQRIAWRSTNGAPKAGIVQFRPKGHNQTLVILHMEYEPEDGVETTADRQRLLSRRVEGDLARFRDLVHARSRETGYWRGEVRSPKIRPRTYDTSGKSGLG